MQRWKRNQESGLLNMPDITKRSQLKPVFTNQIYKHREQLSLVPSMLTMQYLNEGRHFGGKGAVLVQNHPQIKALSKRTSALEASKHGMLVPLAQPLPPAPSAHQPPPQPPPAPDPHYEFNYPQLLTQDEYTTDDDDDEEDSSDCMYQTGDQQSDFVPPGFYDSDFTPRTSDESSNLQPMLSDIGADVVRRYQDEPLPMTEGEQEEAQHNLSR